MQQTNEDIIREQKERIREKMSQIKYKVLVMSGKGGVGKTSVAVNLSYGLSLSGNNVGILDVDLHGPNIAKMLGIEQKSLFGMESGIEPVEVIPRLKAVSLALTGFDVDQPIIWRGPMKTAAIRQFLGDVNWGELDYLIIDSPPGTGDEPLSTCQLIPDISGIIIVTTPQDVAILDSRKSVRFAKELKVPIIGVIENMSGYVCPHCGKQTDLFGKGGGERAAHDLGVPFLGHIPLEPEMVRCGDSGNPLIFSKTETVAAKIMNEITKKITDYVKNDE